MAMLPIRIKILLCLPIRRRAPMVIIAKKPPIQIRYFCIFNLVQAKQKAGLDEITLF